MLSKIIFYIELLMSNEWNKFKVYKKHLGVSFGSNVRITHFPRFGSEPYLISIGNNVTITRNVCFVTHDGGVALFRKEYKGLNVFGKIKIGDNVFIGINTIIMPDVIIGDNVVIGAGSIVNKNIPSNSVYAGVPAKFIKTIEEYKKEALKKGIQINESNRKEQILNHFKNIKDQENLNNG